MEEWRDIKGFEGYYKVSSKGQIISIERKDKNNHIRQQRIIKQRYDKYGYLFVCLCKDGNAKYYKVHRLVASAFIPNPKEYPQVNHKDESKDNNDVNNLEWCDAKYNSNYGNRNLLISKSKTGKPVPKLQGKGNHFFGKHFSGEKSPSAKKVAQYSLNGEYIKTYPCMNEAGRNTGIHSSAISMCCRGKRKSSGGYIWKYA